MSIIKVEIRDKDKVRSFLTLIEDLDYVQVMSKSSLPPKTKVKKQTGNFFAIAGMWEGRNISTHNIRAKAWPKRK